MHLLAVVELIERHDAEYGGEDHAGAVNPDQVLVKPDAAFDVTFGDLRRGNRIVCGRAVHRDREAAESGVEVTTRRGAAVGGAPGTAVMSGGGSARADQGGGHGD